MMAAPHSRYRLVPMRPRNPHEPGRSASNLELFFDLVFVVAVSIASVQLHHELTEGHIFEGVLTYAFVFFGIWWAWVNFTWFATSFDTGDWLYRLMTIVQMGGVLVLASGIEPVFSDHDFALVVLSYVLMRFALVGQWLRAARAASDTRRSALTYATGVTLVQILWLTSLLLPADALPVVFLILVAAELTVPVVAERRGGTPWHPHHLAERHGLFALILLGESLLASANAIIEALREADSLGPLIMISALTLIVTAGLWWIYFWAPHHHTIDGFSKTFLYGYGHYFIFAAAGAFSAGIEVEIDVLTGHSELHPPGASFAYTVPIAVFMLGVWLLVIRPVANGVINAVVPAGALLVLIDPIIPVPTALTAVFLIAVVVVLVWQEPKVEPAAGSGDRDRHADGGIAAP
ncbi:membrane protein [Paractinoplanes abujensis]|uniref:Low temperature requirement protein LtrA n=2 Tax=Paractinoplanes abujensis TaxID=882441 RepID=A0A7W7CS93_9ACTN|nr:low temperature requirement protein A [Actinoplanes abujensis]MBB4693409.1 low temperature requirement protein LtrA [Actinoplanes abujensis]GID24613.1 membrane protein [Actinoplanes abujensis]